MTYFMLTTTKWYKCRKPNLNSKHGRKCSLQLYLSNCYRFVALSEDMYTNKLQ